MQNTVFTVGIACIKHKIVGIIGVCAVKQIESLIILLLASIEDIKLGPAFRNRNIESFSRHFYIARSVPGIYKSRARSILIIYSESRKFKRFHENFAADSTYSLGV